MTINLIHKRKKFTNKILLNKNKKMHTNPIINKIIINKNMK